MAIPETAGPVLRLPEDLVRVAEIVAEVFESHEACARSRALAQAAEALRERARLLRSGHRPDPLTEALRERCHTSGGVIHAAPFAVAAVALEEIADSLDPGEETTVGH